MPQIPMPYTVHLDHTLRVTPLNTLFAKGDTAAHRFELTILRSGVQEELTGCKVVCKFYRMAESAVVDVDGTIEDGKAVAVLNMACYDYIGRFALTIAIQNGEEKTTVFYGDGYMHGPRADTLISGEYIIYDINTLLEKISEIDAATQAANTAASNANKATANANTAATNADEKAAKADNAANGASGWANATMTAKALETGSAPTATVTTASDGHKVITVGIPRGNTGATPQISVQVQTGAAGSEASVSVSGTAENPVIHLTIPRGNTGSIENLTINGNPVESGTITLTAEDVGARPDTWMPSASDVGARPDTWMPSASDVGARALNAAIAHEYTVTLTASGWTGSAAPYTQTVSISGILATDSPIADLDVSSAAAESYEALAAAWACVGRIQTADGQITATCYRQKPEADVTVRMLIVR